MIKNFNTVEDIIQDSEFREWILSPNTRSNVAWEKWMMANPGKKHLIDEAVTLLCSMGMVDYKADKEFKDEIWSRVERDLARVTLDDEKIIPINKLSVLQKDYGVKPRSFSMLYKVAAAVALIAAVVYGVTNQSEERPVNNTPVNTVAVVFKENPKGQKSTFLLPDGTKVNLNAESILSFSERFDGDFRKVTLTGEAFFEVVKDPSRPFIVETPNLDVKVLGTSFNVKAYRNETSNVAVRTGLVKVESRQSNKAVHLHPNDMVIYSDSKKLEVQEIKNKDAVFGWSERNLVFDDVAFHDVLKILSRWYNVNFTVANGDVKNFGKVTAKCGNTSLKEVLESLSHAYEFNYKIDGKMVTIEPLYKSK